MAFAFISQSPIKNSPISLCFMIIHKPYIYDNLSIFFQGAHPKTTVTTSVDISFDQLV